MPTPITLLVDEPDERGPHIAAPEQADLDRGAVHTTHRTYSSMRTRSSFTSRRTTTRAWPSPTNTTAGRVTLL